MRILLLAISFLLLLSAPMTAAADLIALRRAALAGDNLPQLHQAIERTPPDARWCTIWLIAHMPEADLATVDADFLFEHASHAWDTWQTSPWRDHVPEAVFLQGILPYASINERRDAWRAPLAAIAAPMVDGAATTGEAAVRINQQLFPAVGVKYSTNRPKADQSPQESIDAGMASCTGLSILLIDACRSVGVPARFVGTPLWSDNSGNHSWVEVWHDGDWHFTGAAEPSGDDLNKGWFTGRAAGAIAGDPRHAIFAVDWGSDEAHFPLVWLPGDTSYGAHDVTARYTSAGQRLPEGTGRLRIRVLDAAGNRLAHTVNVLDADGNLVVRGRSRDDTADANDHFTVLLPLESRVTLQVGDASEAVHLTADEQRFDLQLKEQPFQQQAVASAIAAWREAHAKAARSVLDSGELRHGDHVMPIFFSRHGEIPAEGRSLYISMHGGGGAPAHVNTQQWKNQQRLYTIDEGIYVAPRAPTDTWNLWHQGHIDPLFDQLITAMVLAENVNPDKVYLTGYSAGGDGVFQLAPRMADRFAAAAMMAGHPNETKPDGLRNLPFTLHMGERDGAYDRNAKAVQWKQSLAELAKDDAGGYPHWVEIHVGKGHWMNGDDAAGLPWMARHVRSLRPERIVWLQDDVTHDRFYWLKVDAPVARDRMVVERRGQDFHVLEPGAPKTLHIRMDESMVDVDQPVRVLNAQGHVLFEGLPDCSFELIDVTLAERGDPAGVFPCEVVVQVGKSGS